MPGRGRQTFNKRQKEQQRKEKQQEKLVRRAQKKLEEKDPTTDDIGDPFVIEPLEGEEPYDTASPQEQNSHTE